MKINPPQKTNLRHKTGQIGEDAAVTYLISNGYYLIERNFRIRNGEIDLIMQKGKRLVFIEVKTRIGDLYGGVEEAVTGFKLMHLKRTSEVFISGYRGEFDEVQIDALLVMVTREGIVKSIRHLENISQ